jgi:hypothetical protein
MKKPNSLAQSGQNVIASKPVPVVSAAEEPSPLKDTVDIPDALDQTLMTESESEKEWIQLWDEEVESNYYYNQITGEASWIRPEEVTDDITSAGGGGGGSDSVTSSAGGGMYPDESWERYWDEDAAAHYLHNTLTGETRWESDYQGTTDLDFALDFEADTKTDH